MKFRFHFDNFDYPSVDCDESIYPVAWVLSDNAHANACNKILEQVSASVETNLTWEMAYNKSVLNINSNRVQCIDLYDEKIFVDMSLVDFEKLVKSWRSFVSKRGNKRETVLFI